MKRIFSVLLALVFVFSFSTAFAEDIEAEPDFELIVVEETEDDEAVQEEAEEPTDDEDETASSNGNEEEPPADVEEDNTEPTEDEDTVNTDIKEPNDDDEIGDEDAGGDDSEAPFDEEDNGDNDSEDDINTEDESNADESEDNDDDKDPDSEEGDDTKQPPAEDYGIAVLSLFQEQPPYLYDVYIASSDSAAEIIIRGDNLEGKKACVKIVSVGGREEIVYMRQIRINSYGGCIVTADLSGCHSQLFKITVDCGRAGRIEKLFTCGEADKLSCTRGLLGIGISAVADIKTVQNIGIKIADTNGTVVYARQIESASDGSYSLSAEFEDIDEDKEYIVSVTEEAVGRQFVKKAGILTGEEAVISRTCTLTGSADGRGEVVVFGKNLADTSKYLYEVTYDPSAMRVKYDNLIGSNIKILSAGEGRIVFSSENRNDAGKLWSGTINAVQFELLSGSGNVTLRVYEKGSENAD